MCIEQLTLACFTDWLSFPCSVFKEINDTLLLCTKVELQVRDLGPVHITPDELESAALFLWSWLPSTLIRHENVAFRKTSSNWRDLKTPVLCFSVDENIFKMELCDYNNVISLTDFFSQTQM